MHKGFAHGCRVGHVRYACHKIKWNFVFCCVKVLAALLFSTLFFLHACFVTESLMYFCFWESSRKAAHAKMTRKRGRSRQKQKKTRSSDLQVMPRLFVICACAASRWPSQKQKCIRNSVTAKAKKTDMCENNKKVRIGSPFFSKSHKAFGHEHRKSRIETGCKISYAFRPIYFRNAFGGQKSVFWTPLKSRNPQEGEDLRFWRV